MSKMADLDAKLTEYKLSDAQKNAVVELMEAPFKNAKPNTIASLVKKGVIEHNVSVDGLYLFTDEFAKFMGWDVEPELDEVDDALDTVNDAERKDKINALVLRAELKNKGWRNGGVWAGLSTQEIKEDIKTAFPTNRKARRTHDRMLKNAFRRLNVKELNKSGYSRKATKMCGLVGV